MLVSSRMIKNPATILPTDTLAAADAAMHAGNFRHLAVVKDGKLLGILSDRDIRQHLGHLRDTKVTGAMTDDAITVTPDTAIEDAAEILLTRKIGALPVVDGSKLVGIITTTDLLNAFIELLGVLEKGVSRIDLVLDPSGDYDLQHAIQIIQRSGAELLGLGSHRENWETRRAYYLVVRPEHGERVADMLTTSGFQVIGVH